MASLDDHVRTALAFAVSTLNATGEPKTMGDRAREKQEAWLEGLGARLVTVWFLVKDQLIDEKHIDDTTTIGETVEMTMRRLRASVAFWRLHDASTWTVYSRAKQRVKHVPTQEAAEMLARHGG